MDSDLLVERDGQLEFLGSPSELEIPVTLQDSLMARLDRLGTARRVAQLGAALGREFPYTLLDAVAPQGATPLREELEKLVKAELLYQRGLPPKATYTFKHALVQDTAYQSLLKSQRVELHGRIADALERQFPERFAREPERIARHCEEAGRTDDAIAHYRRAGGLAADRFAHSEAIRHLQHAIDLLYTLPVGTERDELELQLHVALGAALTTARGYADPDVERVFGRARALCENLGETPELIRAVIGLSAFHQYRGEFRTATELAERALGLAQQAGETFATLAAHTRLGNTLVAQGEFRRALEHCEQAIELYDPSEHRSLASVWGQDWGISARSFAASTLNLLGHPDQARRLSRETVELVQGGDPHRLASALVVAAGLHHDLREREQARERAEETIAITRERGFELMLGMSTVFRGRAVGGSAGLGEIERGLGIIVEAKAVGWLSRCQCILSELHLELGRTDDALAALEAAVTSRGVTDEDFRMRLLRGKILLQQGSAEEGEPCLRRALEIARRQEAKSFELEAATSLSRLLLDRGRRDEARALLQPVYDWFTEGFDTQCLKDAEALLRELA